MSDNSRARVLYSLFPQESDSVEVRRNQIHIEEQIQGRIDAFENL